MDMVANPEVTAAPAPSIGRSLVPLLIISLAVAIGFTAMQSFGIMAESAKRELGLSDTALALIQGGGAALPLLVFSIPIGVWVDRGNRMRLLLIMGITWTLGCFVTAAAIFSTLSRSCAPSRRKFPRAHWNTLPDVSPSD